MSTAATGRKGEEIAAAYLDRNGYRIVARNFRAYGAELDIVAIRDGTLVFAEVKYWRAYDFSELERKLDYRKRARIIRASRGFLTLHPVFCQDRVRYDLLYVNDSGKVAEHVTNAFTETDYS